MNGLFPNVNSVGATFNADLRLIENLSWKLKQLFIQHRIHQYIVLLFYFDFLLFLHYEFIMVIALRNFKNI